MLKTAVGGSVLVTVLAPLSVRGVEQTSARYLEGEARQALSQALDDRGARYDPEAKMVVVERIRKADYTKLAGRRGHPTRESLDYAAHLLEANDAEHRARACEIIAKVMSLQNTNPQSLTYGLWPWYAEEPLHKMFLPDYNWAAFLGAKLLYIIIYHDEQLPPDLRKQVRESIVRACACIRRRPLHVGYTNIASMSSYVTLVAGERLPDAEILAYGRRLFDEWYDYTIREGSFTEFNSPTYTRVALEVVSRMLTDVLDPERRARAETINRMLWTHMARRFHEPTWQWAGPYSRAYYCLESPGFARWIQRAIGGAVRLVPQEDLRPDVWDWRSPYRAPADLAPYFEPLTKPREEVEVFFKAGGSLPNGLGLKGGRISEMPIVGTTHLHPKFALGTVNVCDFWEQHGNLVAHWGTRDKPTYMIMRCEHADHGFCSAALASVQRHGNILAAVGFLTDFGDRFIDIDRLPNHTLKCSDLRVQFEFGGHLGDSRLPERCELQTPLVMTDRGVRITLRYLGGTFAGEEPSLEVVKRRNRVSVVFHLYKGPLKAFRLPDLTEAGLLFEISLSEDKPTAQPAHEPRVSLDDRRFSMGWDTEGGHLHLEGPRRPLPLQELQKQLIASIDGKPPWEYATPLLPSVQK
jgi:hypothetical protein